MPWFKVDDGFARHPKVLSIPRRERVAACGLWALAGSWSAANLTEGYIPKYMLDELAGTSRMAATLVAAGLWHDAESPCEACAEPARGLREARVRLGPGWVFHDWTKSNPTREAVERERDAAAERQRRARERAREAKSAKPVTDMSRRDGGVTNGVSHGPVTDPSRSPRPDPTRPKDSAPTERVPATPSDDPPGEINAGTVVAAWVEANEANGVSPSVAQRGQVGRQARELLLKNDPVRVMEAAAQAGAKGFASLDRELTAMNGRTVVAVRPAQPKSTTRAKDALERAARLQAQAEATAPTLEITQ